MKCLSYTYSTGADWTSTTAVAFIRSKWQKLFMSLSRIDKVVTSKTFKSVVFMCEAVMKCLPQMYSAPADWPSTTTLLFIRGEWCMRFIPPHRIDGCVVMPPTSSKKLEQGHVCLCWNCWIFGSEILRSLSSIWCFIMHYTWETGLDCRQTSLVPCTCRMCLGTLWLK